MVRFVIAEFVGPTGETMSARTGVGIMSALWTPAVLLNAACSAAPPSTAVVPDTVRVIDTVHVAADSDAELQQRLATLQLQLLDKEAQVADLQQKLEDATREVVRSMARMQSLATRAEAASAMAEAEVTLQQLRSRAGQQAPPEIAEAQRRLEMSSAEFNKENYGGALYLANQARTVANAGRGRLTGENGEGLRPGEVRFAVPLQLAVSVRSNVREGPSTRFAVHFSLEPGSRVTGQSYLDQWIHITDDQGRTGWVYYTLVSKVK